MDANHTDERIARRNVCVKWLFVVLIAIAAYLLFAEHRAHWSGLLNYLPFLLLLLCPLMHVFMHGTHGSHKQDESDGKRTHD